MASSSRRFRRHTWRRWIFSILIGAALLARIGQQVWRGEHDQPSGPGAREGMYAVVRVVDGDTLIVRGQADASGTKPESDPIRVRLLGIDCPESVHPERPVEPWALEAAQFTREFVTGQAVQLRLDKRRRDRYQRTLAYVYVGGKSLNEELVRSGLARVSVYPGDSETMARRLRKCEQEARQQRCGLWSK